MPESWPYQIAETTTTPFEIDLDSGEGLIVHNISVRGGADNELLRVTHDRALNYGFMIAPTRRNHLPFQEEGQDMLDLTEQLRNLGFDIPSIKVSESGTLILDTDTNPDKLVVEYEIVAGEGIPTQTAPGGAQAGKYLYLAYGNNSQASSTDDEWLNVDNSIMPVELDDFPFVNNPRAPRRIEPIAIGIDSVANVDTRADHMRVLYNNVSQFTEDRDGILCDPENSNLLSFGGQALERGVKDLSFLPTIEEEDELIVQVQNNYDSTNELSANQYTPYLPDLLHRQVVEDDLYQALRGTVFTHGTH